MSARSRGVPADAWERQYAQRGRLWGGVRLDENTLALLQREPGLRQAGWLDAGCGDGKGLVPLLRELDTDAPVVVALDGSRSALLHARAGIREAHGAGSLRRVVLLRSDVLRPGLVAGRFDVVRAVHLVGHLRRAQREAALRVFFSLLRPGGRLVLSEFGTKDFRAESGEPVEPGTMRRGTGVETHYFGRDELAGLMERTGFSIDRLEAARFRVHYGGKALDRERWDAVALRD